MKKLIFASRNKGKVREVSVIMDNEYQIIPLDEIITDMEIPETESTFLGNAIVKAKTVYNITRTPVIADDSGIEVFQLGGRPGVFSARYAGENASDDENNKKLINELSEFPEPHEARYVCVAVYFDGVNIIHSEGEIRGVITKIPKGKGGFGYDPHFIPAGYTVTMAELSASEKNSISHRGKAFRKLKDLIGNLNNAN